MNSYSENDAQSQASVTRKGNSKGTRRDQLRESRRDQLLEVAAHLFSEYGLEGTTTKDIAKAAGVSPGLLYHYYKSKEDLLVDVVAKFEPGRDLDLIVRKHSEGRVTEALPAIVSELCTYFEERREIMWLISRAATRFPAVKKAMHNLKETSDQLLINFFKERMDAGELVHVDPERLASGLCHVVAMEHMLLSTNRHDVDQLVRALLYGLLPRD